MSRGRIVAALLAGALLLPGCGSDGAPQSKAPPQSADPAAQIAAEEAQWNREYAARDLEALVAHYAPDATLKEPDAPVYSGRWIRLSLQMGTNDPAFAMTFAHDRIEVARSGDIGYSRGHYQVTWTNQQTRQPTTQYGTYLTVWQKQPDGRWRVLEDFMSPGPAPRPLM
jgi:ketosteroid isomerase-like protein